MSTPSANRITKHQTPAQRVANPVWLRDQISRLVRGCDENIEEDEHLADQAHDDKRALYLDRVESHRHWKRQLERILRGKTLAEDLKGTAARVTP